MISSIGRRSAGQVSPLGKKQLSGAEERLIGLLRQSGTDSTAFAIVVRRQQNGRFFVSQNDPRCPAGPSLGCGDTFEEAWQAAGQFSQSPTSSDTVALSLDAELFRALDAWIATQPRSPLTRGEAITRAIREWLTGMGVPVRRPYRDNMQ